MLTCAPRRWKCLPGGRKGGIHFPEIAVYREKLAMPECFVAKVSDLKDGDRRIVVDGKKEIGVFCKDGAYYAYSNYCVHAGGPACEGLIINKVVDIIAADRTYQGQEFSDEVHFACPWHGYEYDLQTGECVGARRLKVRQFDGVA